MSKDNIHIPESLQGIFNSEKFSFQRAEYTDGMTHLFIKDYDPNKPLQEHVYLSSDLFHSVMHTHILKEIYGKIVSRILPVPLEISLGSIESLKDKADIVSQFKMLVIREKLDDTDISFEEDLENIFDTIISLGGKWFYMASRT